MRAAARQMRDANVGALVAVSEEGRPIAVLTDRDLALHALRAERAPDGLRAIEAASRPVVTLPRSSDLMAAARRMSEAGIRRLPIVDGAGTLVGLLAADDLLAVLGEDLHRLAEATAHGFELEAQPPSSTALFGKE